MSSNKRLLPTSINNIDGASGDTTNRLSVSTYQQSNKSDPDGDLIRFLEEHGFAKGGLKFYARGFSAEVITTNVEPFNITTGQTLEIKINNSPTRTITFTPAVSGSATADEISTAICRGINYATYPTGLFDPSVWGQAIVYLTQTGTTMPTNDLKVGIYAGNYGTTSTIEIVGGTALTGLGLVTGTTAGTNGTIDLGNDGVGEQLAWLIAHDYPNNPASNNKHKHFSIEVPDANGEMQTRIAIEFYKNVAQILISSGYLVLDTYPLTIASSANSNKEIYFSRDNTGRDISREFRLRVNSDASGGNLDISAFDAAGTATALLTFDRLLKYMACGGAIQQKIRPSANSSASVMTLTPQNGNVFVLSGTATINYIANTNWQRGSEITIILQEAATLTHNAGSPTGTNRPLKLSGSTNFTAGASGSVHKFTYDGSSDSGVAYNNAWLETSRIVY